MVRPSKNVVLQVLWTGVDENVPCLLMLTENKRYIFNSSEGIQRLFTERRLRIGKLDTFFFTQHRWTHLGGFPGFAMTLRDAKSATLLNQDVAESTKPGKNKKKQKQKQGPSLLNVNVYGPEGIKQVLDAAHRFMKFDKSGMRLFTHEHGKNTKNSDYEDVEMKIFPFTITGSIPVSLGGASLSNHRLLEPLMPSLSQSPSALCYACHLKPLPGKFNLEIARELKIPKGPLYGKLQKGMKITLSDGREILPSDVMAEDIPGVIMLIVDCPTTSYIDSLVKNTAIQKYRCKEQQAHLVVHLAKEEVCGHKDYMSWVEQFSEETRHVFVKDIPKTSVTFRGQHCLQVLLNCVQPEIFPIIDKEVANKLTEAQQKGETLINFTKINVREIPSKKKGDPIFDNSGFKGIKRMELVAKAQQILESFGNNSTQNAACFNPNGKRPMGQEEYFKNKRQHLQNSQPWSMPGEYPRVVCLGTGAALPSKYRNVSATLVFMSENDAILFDCGEDTLGQLSRHYGNNLNAIVNKIKIILVSHMHADHHLGLFSVLRRISATGASGTVIVAPFYYRDWFLQYAETSEVLNCQFVPCSRLTNGSWLCKDIHVQSVKVDHPASAFGYVVKNKFHSVVYSGDTKPCHALVNAGRGCTLLIHEATLDDGLEDEALARLHSTTSQALFVAQNMQAQHLLLNHFSQRYPKIPHLKKSGVSHQTAIAFDHMELTMKDIPKFHDFVPKLHKLFYIGQEEEEKEDQEDEDGLGPEE